ncbi:putative sugar nucleotidyl transferase [Cryomorphaceae bacterium 1068]|nr:putative sugar nucleotidyl transferase [Cryomorphaceae bacterium 1068]
MKTFLIDVDRRRLLPLTFSRPACDLLVGIDSIRDKWENKLQTGLSVLTASYLGQRENAEELNLLIHGSAIPNGELLEAIADLNQDQILTHRGRFIAVKASKTEIEEVQARIDSGVAISFTHFEREEVHFNYDLTVIEKPSDIFVHNGEILRADFKRLSKNYHSMSFDNDVSTKGDEIFVEEGAKLSHCVLNASEGPIYIGRDAEVMEGSLIRGPFSLGANSTLKMGAKIYGDTSIGRHCKVGGEVGNSVVNDYSNKGHDGYLGNSVIGSWCNLGADTNTSNLMNTYGEIKVWDYSREAIVPTGRQFHGLIMGDHSKAGINTMFNTGTVVGMCANIFGGGFPEKFIPSFSWGSPEKGFSEFRMDKAEEAAGAMMSRRGLKLSKRDKDVFHHVAEHDRKYRK